MSDETTLLDDIFAIIEGDVKKIKTKAKSEQLDKASASNLVDYAKLLMASETHQLRLEEAAAKEQIQAEEYKRLRAMAEEVLNRESESE